jgi:hypothetical protein
MRKTKSIEDFSTIPDLLYLIFTGYFHRGNSIFGGFGRGVAVPYISPFFQRSVSANIPVPLAVGGGM